MKYEMREEPDGTHGLYRYGEKTEFHPSNAEVEFWLEIEQLREDRDKYLKLSTHCFAVPPLSPADLNRERCKRCGLNIRDKVHRDTGGKG